MADKSVFTFSTKNTSIAYYASPAIHWTITLFMFLAGTSFTLHFLAFKHRRLQLYLKHPEFRFYTIIAVVASILIVFSLSSAIPATGWEEKIRAAFFRWCP